MKMYTDGSHKDGKVAYAVILVDDNNEIIFSKTGQLSSPEAIATRQVAGELFAVLRGLEEVRVRGIKNVSVHHDYEGVGEWAKGSWKAKNVVTKEYVKRLAKYADIKISWHKVAGHSGDRFNSVVDKMAGVAVNKSI